MALSKPLRCADELGGHIDPLSGCLAVMRAKQFTRIAVSPASAQWSAQIHPAIPERILPSGNAGNTKRKNIL